MGFIGYTVRVMGLFSIDIGDIVCFMVVCFIVDRWEGSTVMTRVVFGS